MYLSRFIGGLGGEFYCVQVSVVERDTVVCEKQTFNSIYFQINTVTY